MSQYEKIIKALRCMELRLSCNECEYGAWSESGEAWGCEFERKNDDAAAAIEALEAEVKRLKDSNDELREKQTFIDNWGTRWMTSAKDVPDAAYKLGYADGKYEALTLERCIDRLHELGWLQEHDRILSEPKRGEWIWMQKANGGQYKGCSVCHAPIPTDSMLDYLDDEDCEFCYSCGAKMEVQE